MAQAAVFAEPANSETRNELASLTVKNGEYNTALAILSSSANADDLRNAPASLGLRGVVETLIAGEDAKTAVKQVQRAIMLSPGDIRNWEILAYMRSQQS